MLRTALMSDIAAWLDKDAVFEALARRSAKARSKSRRSLPSGFMTADPICSLINILERTKGLLYDLKPYKNLEQNFVEAQIE